MPPPWRQRTAFALLLLRLAIAIALLPFAFDWRSPLLASVRPPALAAQVVLPLLLIAIDGWTLRATPLKRARRALSHRGDYGGDRAISGDPLVVADVARNYCLVLPKAGVRCTLKHFSRLGGVFEGTHFESGHLRAPLDELERGDWIPFHASAAATPSPC